MARYRRIKNRFTPIPKEILKEFKLLSINELLAKEVELKEELKQLKSKSFGKNSEYKKIREDYWQLHNTLINKIKINLEKDFPEHKNSLIGGIFGTNKKIETERTVVKDRLSHIILDHLCGRNDLFYKSIDHFGASQMISHFERTGLDINFIRLKEKGPGSHWSYEIKGEYAEKIFSPTYCLSKNELDEYRHLDKKNKEQSHKDLLDKNRIGIIQSLLSIYPSLIKSSKQRKKNTRLAMYDRESREIGSDIVRHIRKTTPNPFACPYCSETTDHTNSHVDHINPISNGGLSVKNNMVLVCSSCNLKKKDHPLLVFCKRSKLSYESVAERLFKLGKWV